MKLSVLLSHLRLFGMVFIGFLLSTTMLIFLSPILFVFFIISQIAYAIIRIKLGSTFTRPGGLDIIQGMESEQSRPYINAIARFKGKANMNKFRDRFAKVLTEVKDEQGNVRFKKLTQVFEKVCGYHVLRDAKDFDIRNHIKRVELQELFPEEFAERPGNEFAGKKPPVNRFPRYHGKWSEDSPMDNGRLPKVPWELLISRLLAKYGSSPLEPGLPQWEFLFVEEDDK